MPLKYRYIRGYPKKKAVMIRRYKRGAVKTTLLRRKRPRIHARPWKWRTKSSPTAHMESRADQHVYGSLQERIVYKALVARGFIPGVDFTFQSSQLGGRMELGGLVADFLFPIPKVILQVQSAWHTITLYHEVRDKDQKLLLESMGYTVLEIWPNTIEDAKELDQWFSRNIMTLWGAVNYSAQREPSREERQAENTLEVYTSITEMLAT